MFEKLQKIKLEDICKGRKAAILVKPESGLTPVIRSTTIYKNKPQLMPEFLYKENYNNAMIELYTNEYRTMSYHSDLALDLVGDICIYSCYPKEEKQRRKLMIKNKTTKEVKEIIMEDNKSITFDLEFNRENLHKIVGTAVWMGITYRKSNTYSNQLRLATENEKVEFFKLRSLENKNVNFVWPKIDYTICSSELLEAGDI